MDYQHRPCTHILYCSTIKVVEKRREKEKRKEKREREEGKGSAQPISAHTCSLAVQLSPPVHSSIFLSLSLSLAHNSKATTLSSSRPPFAAFSSLSLLYRAAIFSSLSHLRRTAQNERSARFHFALTSSPPSCSSAKQEQGCPRAAGGRWEQDVQADGKRSSQR